MTGIRKRLGSVLGPEGRVPQLLEGTTTQVSPGEPARVTFTKTGDAEYRVDAQVPRGLDGDPTAVANFGQAMAAEVSTSGSAGGAAVGAVAELAATNQTRATSYYWTPEPQPSARLDEPGNFTDGFGLTAPQYIDQLFEPLRASHPDYVTRESLGKDESGDFDVWRYEFSPAAYTKTIIVVSAVHGGELTGMLAMARFLHYLTNDWDSSPQLAYLRNHVRIVYLPIVNPWGVSQISPRTRYNVSGVDINRNFPHNWGAQSGGDPYGHDYKGPAPASEAETQYYIQTLEEYPDAIACLDFHNTGVTDRDLYAALPSDYPHKTIERVYYYLAEKWGVAEEDIRIGNSGGRPQSNEWVWATYEIPAAIVEWCDSSISGDRIYSAAEITGALTLFANVILEHCRAFDTAARPSLQSFTVTNAVANASLQSTDGWGGLVGLGVENGELYGTQRGTGAPYVRGDIDATVSTGDTVYLAVTMFAPPNVNQVELRLRDPETGLSQLVASIDEPETNRFHTLSGTYQLTEPTTDPKIQARWLFDSAEVAEAVQMRLTQPLVAKINTIDREGMQVVKDAGWFEGSQSFEVIRNADSIPAGQRTILNNLLNRIAQLES